MQYYRPLSSSHILSETAYIQKHPEKFPCSLYKNVEVFGGVSVMLSRKCLICVKRGVKSKGNKIPGQDGGLINEA